MKYGFVKVAVASPRVTVADCPKNIKEIIRIATDANAAGVRFLLFPELAVTSATAGDLLLSSALLSSARSALNTFLKKTAGFDMVTVLGLPFLYRDRIYNCAAVCHAGKLLGIVPKTHLPDSGASSEARIFAPAPAEVLEITEKDECIPFGSDLVFTCDNMPAFRFGVVIGDTARRSDEPVARLTRAGAAIIANLTATDEIVGRAEERRTLAISRSRGTASGYLLAGAGKGESSTDLVFSGHSLIAEYGKILAERAPYDFANELTITEIDLDRLSFERRRTSVVTAYDEVPDVLEIPFDLKPADTALTRRISPFPFLPDDPAKYAPRMEEILSAQAAGLCQRIEKAYAKKCVIGISGGLDSTLALLVSVRAMDMLGRDRRDVIGVTMPCFGTTARTKGNAERLCEELGVELRCVNIAESVRIHFRDIGQNPENHDVTFENAQARERTQVIMDIANMEGGMVIGTGDLSELALGWATYNGDHMSMYGVNASVPKTLIRHVVAHSADKAEEKGESGLAAVLRDILDTPVSPELLPATEDGKIAQKTEDIVGPYELHDFFLYNMIRYGFTPDKIFHLAKIAFAGVYDSAVILRWLENFTRRFFSQQFKRSCVPDGPKVGAVALSPRGDFRCPSDASSAVWLETLRSLE